MRVLVIQIEELVDRLPGNPEYWNQPEFENILRKLLQATNVLHEATLNALINTRPRKFKVVEETGEV
jgi:hypothetical protein